MKLYTTSVQLSAADRLTLDRLCQIERRTLSDQIRHMITEAGKKIERELCQCKPKQQKGTRRIGKAVK